MAAARYWRLVGIETYAGGDLELSELHLYGASGRLDAAATLTSAVAPIVGTLANLQDDNLSTTCRFAGAAVRASGFWIRWDLSSAADVTGIAASGSLIAATLQCLVGGRWLTAFRFVQGKAIDRRYVYMAARWPLDGNRQDFGPWGAGDLSVLSDNLQEYGPGLSPFAKSALFAGSNTGFYQNRALVSLGKGVAAFGQGDFEISLWVYLDAADSQPWGRICESKLFGALGGFNLVRVDTFNPPRVRFHLSDGTTLLEAGMSNVAWHSVNVRRKAGKIGLLIDGAVLAVADSLHDFSAPDFAVGGNINGMERIAGRVNDVQLFSGYSRPIEPEAVSGPSWPEWTSPDGHATRFDGVWSAASSALQAHSAAMVDSGRCARDIEFGGTGKLWGTTKTKGSPANSPTKARVVLLHQRSKLPVRETWSDPVTGAFVFSGIDTNQQFLTLAEDAAGNFRPVAANRLTPEVP